MAAAQGLFQRGRAEAVQAMIQECNRSPHGELPKELIEFLLRCNHVEAVQTLAKNLRRRPVDTAREAIEAACPPRPGWEKDAPQLTPAVQNAIDRLLVEELDDRRQDVGTSYYWEDQQFSDPLLCDLSADVLTKRWKLPSFRFNDKLAARGRQRWQLKNAWLGKQGQKPVPPPEDPIRRLPKEQVLPLVRSLAIAASEEDRREMKLDLVALGLPSLPTLRAKLGDFPVDSLTRQTLSDAFYRQIRASLRPPPYPTAQYMAKDRRVGQYCVDLLLMAPPAGPPAPQRNESATDQEKRPEEVLVSQQAQHHLVSRLAARLVPSAHPCCPARTDV